MGNMIHRLFLIEFKGFQHPWMKKINTPSRLIPPVCESNEWRFQIGSRDRYGFLLLRMRAGPYGAGVAKTLPLLLARLFTCAHCCFHSVRRYPRPVLRPDEAIRSGRFSCQHTLPLPWGLCGQGLLQYWGEERCSAENTRLNLVFFFFFRVCVQSETGFARRAANAVTVQEKQC